MYSYLHNCIKPNKMKKRGIGHLKKQCCGTGAEEPKLNCILEPEPKLRIAAPAPPPAPFYLPYLKIMVAKEFFVNYYNFNPNWV
jgi:hypothetical protein